MWKPDAPESSPSSSTPASRQAAPDAPLEAHVRAPLAQGEPATIGKSLVIRGEITGTDSLVLEGRVEGSIHLDGNRVTVGPNGRATANITAREVVIMGKVRGNITATDRLDIRAEGGVVGDLAAPRMCIEDGAFFKGGIEIGQLDPKQAAGHVGQTKTPARAAKPSAP